MKEPIKVTEICTICWENSKKGSKYNDVCDKCNTRWYQTRKVIVERRKQKIDDINTWNEIANIELKTHPNT